MINTILDFLQAAGAPPPSVSFKTADWTIWNKDAAGVLTEEDEIEQTVINICSTALGSDPLRPEFGCDYLPLLDMPLNRSAGLLRARFTTALLTWEKRVEIVSIEIVYSLQGRLKVTMNLKRANLTNATGSIVSFVLQ